MRKKQATEEFELSGAAADVAAEAMPRRRGNGHDGALAEGLGWFSLGLGVAEVAAPGLVTRLIGISNSVDNRETLRAAGLREIASGVGILTRDRRAAWMRARVGGDVMDLALLGGAFRSDEARPRRLAAATAAVAGVTALDVFCSRKLSSAEGHEDSSRVVKAITVNRSPAEVYEFWRQFENLPRFMQHVESVRVTGPARTHWKVSGPAGTAVEWDAETTEDRPNERIAWRSVKGADVDNSGSVRFRPAPGRRGTEVIVEMRYRPPAGALGSIVASLMGEEPGQQMETDLRRFKQVIETGEISRTQASESTLGMGRPGQPGPVRPYHEFARGER